jgi:hypothetical protein
MNVGFILCLHAVSFTAEEAQKAVKGLEENIIHTKYIELVCLIKLPGGLLLTLVFYVVCGTEANGTGSCEGETKVAQGQGCRYSCYITPLV